MIYCPIYLKTKVNLKEKTMQRHCILKTKHNSYFNLFFRVDIQGCVSTREENVALHSTQPFYRTIVSMCPRTISASIMLLNEDVIVPTDYI